MQLAVASEQEMEALGARLAEASVHGGLIFLKGNLGAGKTTLVRGFLRRLGYQGIVKSPTYALIESYEIEGRFVHHLDLYRLQDPEELEYLGFRELQQGEAICLIEWPEKAAEQLMQADLVIQIDYAGQERSVKIATNTSVGREMVDLIQQ